MPQAIVMRRYGGPEVLTVEDVALAPLEPDEIRVRAIASAVNHSPRMASSAWRRSDVHQGARP